jgi:siroheme synthase
VIEEGTTLRQRVVTGTLADIVPQAQDIHPPALLIVGEVVRLREQIDWFKPQPSGLSVKSIQAEILSI